jgi:Lon-like protease
VGGSVSGYHVGYPADRRSRPPHTRIGRGAGSLLTVVVLGVLAGVALMLVKVDQVVYHPGPVYDTLGSINETPVVQLGEGLETFETEGRLYFTTISVAGGPGDPLSAWDWLVARWTPSTTVVPREQVFPENVTREQVRDQNTALMQHSQEDAAVVALRTQGIEVPEQIVVAQVIVDTPADGVLEVDDQILTVAGETMTDAEAVRSRLQEVEAGQSVSMTIRRDGEEVSLEVPTVRNEETDRTIVGVYLAPKYDLPYEVTIDAGNVGGSSAGLMFALAVYDEITPGALTGGKTFAGTGTISGTGQVGTIGGVKQKMHAAAGAAAEVFLTPAGNCAEVVGNEPGDLVVVPVETFKQAVDVVERSAADDPAGLDLPTCRGVLDAVD